MGYQLGTVHILNYEVLMSLVDITIGGCSVRDDYLIDH